MKNKYSFENDLVLISINAHGKTLVTLIDRDDFDIADSFRGTWYASLNKVTNKYYVYGTECNGGKKKTIQLHRLLCGNPSGKVIDHFNHDPLDNRRSTNLRISTNVLNLQNRKGPTSRNKSGFLGVSLHRGKWRAVVTVNGKPKHIGYYETDKEAAIHAADARKRLLPFSQEAAKK